MPTSKRAKRIKRMHKGRVTDSLVNPVWQKYHCAVAISCNFSRGCGLVEGWTAVCVFGKRAFTLGLFLGCMSSRTFCWRIHFFKIYPFHTAIFILSYFILSDLFIIYPINFRTPFALHAQYDRPPQVKFLRGFVLKVSILNKIRRLGRRLSRVFCFE